MNELNSKYFSFTDEEKVKIFKYLKFIIITVLLVYAVEVVRFTKPLWDKIYFGNLTIMFINVCRIILYIPLIVFLFRFSKLFLPISQDENEHKKLSLKRVLILYFLTVFIIVIVSASLKWKVKLVNDLGENITGMAAVNNISYLLANVVKMFIVLLVIRYSQELFEIIFKKFKYNEFMPYGGLVSLLLFGIYELLVAGVCALNVVFLFMHIVYGLIYVINKKNYSTSAVINILILLF